MFGNPTESCYAQAVATAVEYAHEIRTGEVLSVSAQELWDVGVSSDGGNVAKCFDWIVEHGISLEENYPWRGSKGSWMTLYRVSTIFTLNQ